MDDHEVCRDDRDCHREHGKHTNQVVWALLDQGARTEEDDQRMIDAAHASAHHWRVAGTAENHTRGEWLLSRAYTVVGRAEPARHHAQRAMTICEVNGIGGFDLAYAYEAVARSSAAAGLLDDARRYRALAEEATAGIADPEDKEIFEGDLAAEPWFGA